MCVVHTLAVGTGFSGLLATTTGVGVAGTSGAVVVVIVAVVAPPGGWLRVLTSMVPSEPMAAEVIEIIEVSTAGSA